MNNQAVFLAFDIASQLGKLVTDSLQPVRFLDPKLPGPSNNCITLSKHGCHSNNRYLIHQAWNNICSKAGAMKLGIFHQNICHQFATALALVLDCKISSHILQHIYYASSGFIDAHIFQKELTTWNNGCCHQPKGCRANIPRHYQLLWSNQLVRCRYSNAGPFIFQLYTKGLQHKLCVISGRVWLHYSGFSLCKKSR